MTAAEATLKAQALLANPTATAFYDEESPLYPYLIAINTPSGDLGVIATGRTYEDALSKANLWLTLQKRPVQA